MPFVVALWFDPRIAELYRVARDAVAVKKSATVADAVNARRRVAVAAAASVIVEAAATTVTAAVELTPAYVGPDESVAEYL